jgi:putative membrane protein
VISRVGGWAIGWAWIWPALIVVGLALLGYVALRLARGGLGTEDAALARRDLDERYARGEIDEPEYRRRRDQLEGR